MPVGARGDGLVSQAAVPSVLERQDHKGCTIAARLAPCPALGFTRAGFAAEQGQSMEGRGDGRGVFVRHHQIDMRDATGPV